MLAVYSSLSRSALISVVLMNAYSPVLHAEKNKKENDSWIIPTTLGLVGGVLVGTALTTWCKNAEINDIDYRPLTSLQELNTKVTVRYSHLLDNINSSGSHFYDFVAIKRAIHKELPYDSFISNLETYENDIRLARKQLKNQIKYWDARLHDGYAEARNILAKTKITYKKLHALRHLAQEMTPMLKLETTIQNIKSDVFLNFKEITKGLTNIYQAALNRNNEDRFVYFLMVLAHRNSDGSDIANRFVLIAYAECIEQHMHTLEKAIQLHKNKSGAHFDAGMHQQAKSMLQTLEIAHAVLTQSTQFKSEVAYKKESDHRQKIQRELEEQTRLARKQLEYEREQLRYAREQRDTQLRTEQQIALLRLENAVRDLYS